MSNSRNGELDRTIQLAVGEVGCSVSNSPNGELDQSCRASPSPSWINPEPGILVSGTPPFGSRSDCLLFRLDQSYRRNFTKKRQKLIFWFKFGSIV
ncbi:hypothetical protein F2Q69_00013283 [Brassica cretica]|uniref:Uncharacterized protein n=1 Tax=Brassica cretica TaxID=69181 RepID=A0A8S9RA64_BRACR|nr:hypothetical protein F2Q69_00013283 [Brassica cretica]